MSKSGVVILSSSLWLQYEFVELFPTYLVWFVYLLVKGVIFFHDKYSPVEILFNSLVKKAQRNAEGSNAGTNPGDGRVHIQDNPSATCAMKIRPLCRGNVIVCVPSADCAL